MKNIRLLGAALAASLVLAACGGGDDAKNTSPYGKLVIFGDSLSDVGTHATQGVVLGAGGGKYTVNGIGAKIWVEALADELGVPMPCAAKVGLEADVNGPFAKLAQTPKAAPGCYGYAQGGSRVVDPKGSWNKALLLDTPPDTKGYLGQLTEPIVTQIGNHLAVASKFAADDLVTVMAGGNDVFQLLTDVSTARKTPTEAVQAMGLAGAQLAGLVKAQILANGAKRVVVLNIPDFAVTPFFATKDVQTRGLVTAMTTTFNGQLTAGLAGTTDTVIQVDAYTLVQDFVNKKAQFGLTVVDKPACAVVPDLGAAVSLICNTTTVVAGDVSHYAFADDVHPTPYAHGLLKQLVVDALQAKGWR